MVTKEWVAIHRKHHAKCETEEDPHSPQTRGIKTVLLTGAELYRTEAKNQETMAKFGHGTPDDWFERNLYSRYSWQGVGLMLIIEPGAVRRASALTVWAVQMLWIPITGPPASSTASATGGAIAISRHPTRAPTSCRGASSSAAKSCTTTTTPTRPRPSSRSRHTSSTSAGPTSAACEMLGWAKVAQGAAEDAGSATCSRWPTAKTLEAIIANRYEVMAELRARNAPRHAARDRRA